MSLFNRLLSFIVGNGAKKEHLQPGSYENNPATSSPAKEPADLYDRLLDLYNEKFSNTLVGRWPSEEGTFFMMSDEFYFSEDGTGTHQSEGTTFKMKTYFRWKIPAPFHIEILWESAEYDDEVEDEDIEEEEVDKEERWVKFEYEFRKEHTDVSTHIYLFFKGKDNFYGSHTRIAFSGQHDLEKSLINL